MRKTDIKKTGLAGGEPRLSPLIDLGLRMLALVLVIAGAAIGLGEPAGIVLVAAGLMLLILEQTLKHLPGRRSH